MAIRTTPATKRRPTGDTATIARKRFYRSAERYLKQSETATGATRERLRYLAERDLKSALNTYSKSYSRPYSKDIQKVAADLGINLEDERERIKSRSDKAAEKIRQETIEVGEGASYKRLKTRKIDTQARREEEATAILNSPIGTRIIGGLVDVWRDEAVETVIDEAGKEKEKLIREKLLPSLFEHFKVDNVADLIAEIESIVGDALYAKGEQEIYDVVKLTLQTHVIDNSVTR